MTDPEYFPEISPTDNLADVVWKLRPLTFSSIIEAARYFCYSHSTIARYETGYIHPPMGYLACLTKRSIEQLQSDDQILDEVQKVLLRRLNTVLMRSDRKPFQDWDHLCSVADEYLSQRLAKYDPRSAESTNPIQFHSCFISYSHKDEAFVRQLYIQMREEHLRVWYAPEDVKGGEKIYEQIDQAIQLHDRVLLVLSEFSIHSEWVMTEIRYARKVELKEKRRKLFPIRLCSFETLQHWECFDPDTRKDLALEVREYFIPDFSNWKDRLAFKSAFARLLKDLRSAETKAAS
jgi:hypothetical protein